MHMRLEAENVVQEKFQLWVKPDGPVTMGLTWSMADDVPELANEVGSASSSSTAP